jgi:hypothetical protein
MLGSCGGGGESTSSEKLDPKRGLVGSVGTPQVYRFDAGPKDLEAWWTPAPGSWSVEDGVLVGDNAYNSTLWLREPIPAAVRIEFDAQTSEGGDIRVEIFGDGENHESGYIAVYHAWGGVTHVLARLDEHEENRAVVAPTDALESTKRYRMAIVRTDKSLRWFVDGQMVLEYADPEPLTGTGHDRFGLSSWKGRVRFDNVQVFPLGGESKP